MTKKNETQQTQTPEAGIKSGLAAFMATMGKPALPAALVDAAAKWAANTAQPVFYKSGASADDTHHYHATSAEGERFAALLASFLFRDCSPMPLYIDGLPALGQFVSQSETHARQLAEAGKLKVSRRAHTGDLPPALIEKGGVKAFLQHLAGLEPLESKPAILPSSPKPGSGKPTVSIEDILGDLF